MKDSIRQTTEFIYFEQIIRHYLQLAMYKGGVSYDPDHTAEMDEAFRLLAKVLDDRYEKRSEVGI
jgi:hypothetical protein